MIYGYARVSTNGQRVTARVAQLRKHGADKVFHPAQGLIEGETLLVSSPDVKDPVAVRYAWSNDPEANLFNGAGLPATPFRSDAW